MRNGGDFSTKGRSVNMTPDKKKKKKKKKAKDPQRGNQGALADDLHALNDI